MPVSLSRIPCCFPATQFLREFTQRKTSQAVEIRQHRAALLALSTEGRSGALVATQEGTGPFSNGQEQRAPGAADDKIPWQESSWEDTPSNMLKLRPSTTMRASFMLRTPPGGSNASLSSLDILLQNVLQRSTAVSTKLTKAYAQGVVSTATSLCGRILFGGCSLPSTKGYDSGNATHQFPFVWPSEFVDAARVWMRE